MKKLFCRIFSCLLIGSMFLAANPVAIAAAPPDEGTAEPQASYFLSSYSSYVAAVGSGKVQVWFDVNGVGTMSRIGATRVILYESTDNKSWTAVKTFRYTAYTSMTATNKMTHTSYVPYSGVSGRYYKATVTAYAEKNGGCDSRLIYTSVIKA
ncbi:MAG: hypothetical protein Q4P20_11845 [Eubacteriales bacterium]|nr:hypothetical protein [Eubacteriales bacterium]